MRTSNFQYITNNQGVKTSVIIPIKDWQKINTELDILNQELSYIELLKKELSIISEKEMMDRALISENQISTKQYSTLQELESEMNNW